MTRDIELFGKGVETVIGERGVNISGGQKARISLARAIYNKSDIVLLDDPLSAVDPEVASSIFHDAIRGALKDRLVILVTHQLQFLENCEKIMLIQQGKVSKLGSYEDITASGFNIKDILDSFNQTNKENASPKKAFKKETFSASPNKEKERTAEKKKEGQLTLVKQDSKTTLADGPVETKKEEKKNQVDLVK